MKEKITLKASEMVSNIMIGVETGETVSNLIENHLYPLQEELSRIDVSHHELSMALKNLIELIDDCVENKECTNLIQQHYTYLKGKEIT